MEMTRRIRCNCRRYDLFTEKWYIFLVQGFDFIYDKCSISVTRITRNGNIKSPFQDILVEVMVPFQNFLLIKTDVVNCWMESDIDVNLSTVCYCYCGLCHDQSENDIQTGGRRVRAVMSFRPQVILKEVVWLDLPCPPSFNRISTEGVRFLFCDSKTAVSHPPTKILGF